MFSLQKVIYVLGVSLFDQGKEIFESQLKKATEELDEMHKRLDEEQEARTDLKKSLKAASAELEEWKEKSSTARYSMLYFCSYFHIVYYF